MPGGAYNTHMQMGGGGMNPFANQGGIGYQNPGHNKPTYTQSAFAHNDNPFTGNGPSMESWQKDYHELGKDVNLNVPKKNDNDNIDEFKDLFSTGLTNLKKSSPRHRKQELVYNPGELQNPTAAHA